MPTTRTQDGNCCRLDQLLDEQIGAMVPPEAADEVAEHVETILAQDLHPRTQELVAAIDSAVMAAYAMYLNRIAAEEVASRDLARTA